MSKQTTAIRRPLSFEMFIALMRRDGVISHDAAADLIDGCRTPRRQLLAYQDMICDLYRRVCCQNALLTEQQQEVAGAMLEEARRIGLPSVRDPATLDRERRETAEAAFVDHDFEPEVVRDSGAWRQTAGDLWQRDVYLACVGPLGWNRRVTFVVRFAADWTAVVRRCGVVGE